MTVEVVENDRRKLKLAETLEIYSSSSRHRKLVASGICCVIPAIEDMCDVIGDGCH